MKVQVEFTVREADSLVALISGLGNVGSHYLRLSKAVEGATNKIDEAMARREIVWERCKACDGTGWQEDAA